MTKPDHRSTDLAVRETIVVAAVLAVVLSVDLGPFERPDLAPLRSLFFLTVGIGGAMAARTTSLSRREPAERLLLAAFCWLGITSVLSSDPVGGAVVAAALLGTFLAGTALARSMSRSDLWLGLSAGMFVVMGAAAFLGSTDGDTRWAGLSEEPNALAVVAALAVVVAVVRQPRPFSGAVVALGGVTLYATDAALPSLAALLGVAIWMTRRWPSAVQRGTVAAGLTLACAVMVAVVALPAEALPGDGYNLETINERTQIWSYLVERIHEAPLLGHGPRASNNIAARGAFDIRVHWGPQHAHNAPLELAMAGGLPAAALFVAGLATAMWRSHREQDTAAVAVLATLILLAVTEPLVRDPTIAVLLMGVAVVRPSESANRVNRHAALSEPSRQRDETLLARP